MLEEMQTYRSLVETILLDGDEEAFRKLYAQCTPNDEISGRIMLALENYASVYCTSPGNENQRRIIWF